MSFGDLCYYSAGAAKYEKEKVRFIYFIVSLKRSVPPLHLSEYILRYKANDVLIHHLQRICVDEILSLSKFSNLLMFGTAT